MNLATLEVSGVQARAGAYTRIPAGITGATVTVSFTDPRWEELSKTAVFQGCVTRDVLMEGSTVVVPQECVAQPGQLLRIGIYGTDGKKNLAIPTLWATIGTIQEAADPSGDPSVDPALPVWAQLQEEMEQLEAVKEAEIQQAVSEYMEQNPSQTLKTDATLVLKEGVLCVNTTNQMEQDNTLPITSAGVYSTVGNIEALLQTI